MSHAPPALAAPAGVPPSMLGLPQVLAQIVDEAPVGLVQADAEGRMVRVNRRWCEQLQMSPAELLGRSITEVTHPEDWPATQAAVQRLAGGGPNFSIDQRYVRRDGSTLWATSSVTALRSLCGQYQGLVAVVLDVSERHAQALRLQQLARELAEANRRKSDFLATLAHELRNPLAPLTQALQLIQRPGSDVRQVREAADIMDRQLHHLKRLVEELLDISRIARGKMALRPAPVALHEVLQAALDQSGPLVQQKHHRLDVHLPPEKVYLMADPTRLAQVLCNLVSNAAKYTPEGGDLCVQAQREGEQVRIEVRDNGVGLSPQDLPHIFELFTQVGHSLDMAQGGLGIGLALSRQLVELHGGRLSAHSEGLGRGSVFTVELPTCAAPSADRPPPEAPPSGAAAGLRLLVVDDNVDGANTLAALLRACGHDTAVAYDGPAALAQAHQHPPQAAFLDLGMPGMDGLALARELRKQHPQLPLVALTGWASDTDRQRCVQAGFNAHLAKPVDLAALEATLARLPVTPAARPQPSSVTPPAG